MYKVLADFSDSVGGGVYHKGEGFPRPGVTVDEERIAYLMGNGNKLGYPVIEAAEDAPKPRRKK